jgi:hypothetical protein
MKTEPLARLVGNRVRIGQGPGSLQVREGGY